MQNCIGHNLSCVFSQNLSIAPGISNNGNSMLTPPALIAICGMPYTTQSTAFTSGDVLLLYSDALLETPNANGEYITEEGLMAFMTAHQGLSSEEIKDELTTYFVRHSNSKLSDDLTFTIFTRS
jgi:serine phosphatase RsbU (regulator of sigma subunit)